LIINKTPVARTAVVLATNIPTSILANRTKTARKAADLYVQKFQVDPNAGILAGDFAFGVILFRATGYLSKD
jgi:hypothetical protein